MEPSEYELVSPIDASGQAVIWKAMLPGGQAAVVRFFPRPLSVPLAQRAERLLRLRQEGQGQYLATPLAISTEDTRVAIISEYVEGPTLTASLAQPGALSFNRRVLIARDLARALVALHDGGVTHLDLSANNVIVGAQQAVLIDLLDPCGYTPGYAAPELVEAARRGETLSEAAAKSADWWAWGAICQEMGIELDLAEQCLQVASQRPSPGQIAQWCEQVEARLTSVNEPLRVDDIIRTDALASKTVHHRQRGRRRRPAADRDRRTRMLVASGCLGLAALTVLLYWGFAASAAPSMMSQRSAQALAAPSGGEGTSAPASPVCPSTAEAEAVLRQLTKQRQVALETGQPAKFDEIYADPNGSAIRKDRQLLEELRSRGITVSELSTQIGQVAVSCEDGVEVTFATAEEDFQWCEGDTCRTQTGAERTCMSMQLAGPAWKIVSVEAAECSR